MAQDLFTAIVDNDTSTVETLLKKDKKLAKSKSDDGEPALIEAVKYGRLEIARLLLDAGAKVDQQGKFYRMTAAEWAIHMNRVELLELLLHRGFNAKAVNAKKAGMLAVAALADLRIVKLLVSRGAKESADALVTLLEHGAFMLMKDPKPARQRFELLLKAGAKINGVNRSKETALHMAVREGAVPLAKHLIDLGADVNFATAAGLTPLHYAAALGKVGCLRLLLKAGADKKKKDKLKNTPADVAKESGHLFSHELLTGGKKAVPSPDELSDAIFRNDVKDVRSMISRSESTKTAMIPIGVTEMFPLHLACCYGSGETVKTLIDLGCDVNAKCGQFEQFPLYEAAELNNADAIRALAAAGADLEQVRDGNKTALFAAVDFHSPDAVKALLESGAKVTGLITRVAEAEAKDVGGGSIFDPPEKRNHEQAQRREIADLVMAAYERQASKSRPAKPAAPSPPQSIA